MNICSLAHEHMFIGGGNLCYFALEHIFIFLPPFPLFDVNCISYAKLRSECHIFEKTT